MTLSLRLTDEAGTSLGDRLRSARVAAGLSTRALAARISSQFQLSHATLANYERGLTKPDPLLVSAIAIELERPLEWFLKSGKSLENVRYRNRKSLVTQTQCVQFEFTSQTWLDAYKFVEGRLSEPLAKVRKHALKAFQGKKPADAAKAIREALGLRGEEPIQSVPQTMELFGIRVIEVSTSEAIDGLAALYDGEHVTALARDLEGDRSRMNAAHEFGHFVGGDVDTELAEADSDKHAFEFASHLLMPPQVLKKAIERKSIVHLVEIKRLFGISLAAMIYRAEKSGLITKREAKNVWVEFAKRGWRHREPGRIAPDRALRFDILLERALKLKKASVEDVATASGLSTSELKDRLREQIGYLDEHVELVDREPARILRLATND